MSTCKHSYSYPSLKKFLRKVEENMFSILPDNVSSCNLKKNVWFAIRGFAEDHNIVIKPASKWSWVVFCLKNSLLAKAYQ